MLLTLLLLVHAHAEWVEITQLPRKPIRTHQQTTESELSLQTRRDSTLQFSTEPTTFLRKNNNRIYINHSLEKHWSKGVVHRVPNIGNVKRIHLTTEEPARWKYEETDLSELSQGYTKRNPFKTFDDRLPEFVTKEESFEDDDEVEELHFKRNPSEEGWTERNEIKINGDGTKPNIPVRRIDTGIEETEPVTSKTPDHIRNKGQNQETTTESDAKVNTMENVLKFVKVVTDTITRNTRRSFSSKVRYLEELQDTIIVNIEDRMESLFPDESPSAGAARRRRRRGARGHVELPSSEGALMTISFLTFAVYLIKLVLQVIHSYKNKTMMMTPAVFAAVGRAAKRKGN